MPVLPETNSILINELINFADLSRINVVYTTQHIKEYVTNNALHRRLNVKTIEDGVRPVNASDEECYLLIAYSLDELLQLQPLYLQNQHNIISVIMTKVGTLNTIVQAASKGINDFAIYTTASLREVQEIIHLSTKRQPHEAHPLIIIEMIDGDTYTDKNQELETTLLSRRLLKTENEKTSRPSSAKVPPIKILGSAKSPLSLISIGASAKISLLVAEILRPTIEVAVVQPTLVSPLPSKELSEVMRQFRYCGCITHHTDSTANYIEEQLQVGPIIKFLIDLEDQDSPGMVASQILTKFTYK